SLFEHPARSEKLAHRPGSLARLRAKSGHIDGGHISGPAYNGFSCSRHSASPANWTAFPESVSFRWMECESWSLRLNSTRYSISWQTNARPRMPMHLWATSRRCGKSARSFTGLDWTPRATDLRRSLYCVEP